MIVSKILNVDLSSQILSQCHIGRTRHFDHIDSCDRTSRRIFRQGFEYIEPVQSDEIKPLKVGLNFVSFQNDPSRLFFILTDPNWLGNSSFGGVLKNRSISNLLSVVAAGMFFVPPDEKPFPGASFFT